MFIYDSSNTYNGALEIIIAILNEVGYIGDEYNTLALHILNVAHVVNITAQSTHSAIYLAALWLDNIVLNVMSEINGKYLPSFMYDQCERILYVVNDTDCIKHHPVLYKKSNGMLDVWRESHHDFDHHETLTVANTWYIDVKESYERESLF